MKRDINSQVKYNCILSIIGIILSAVCLTVEVVIKGNSTIFWLILLLCNLTIFFANLAQKERGEK